MSRHEKRIREEFTKQAAGFAAAPQIRDEDALNLVVEASGASAADTVLDVACGPGLVVCAFSRIARWAVGVDLTPAMLEEARRLEVERGVRNVAWQLADVARLPFSNGSFSIVVSRYAFHHLLDPERALAEMVRVCSRGGRVAVVDVIASSDPEKAEAFNRAEKLRDPSHVRALSAEELHRLFRRLNLPTPTVSRYRLEFDLDLLLGGSFPKEGDRDRAHASYVDFVDDDAAGFTARREGDAVICSYPIGVHVVTL